MEPGEYESIRLKNLEDNKRVLAAFGLMNPFKPVQCVVKKASRPIAKPRPAKKRPPPTEDVFPTGSLYGARRKSARLDGKEAGQGLDLGSTYEELDDAEKKAARTPVDRPNFYGPIPDIEVGYEWATRMECSKDGVHRPTVAGIHGGQDGAYSIALSGGYEDDLDLGDCFTYTGEGGRDLKGTKNKPKNLRTAPQSKDQTLTRGNLALSRSVDTKNPVRVIRGYKLRSQFAPEEGYRYDGIYTVEKFWFTTGLSGYGVWKFALKRCTDQALSPWQFLQDGSSLTPEQDAKSPSSSANAQELPGAESIPVAELSSPEDDALPLKPEASSPSHDKQESYIEPLSTEPENMNSSSQADKQGNTEASKQELTENEKSVEPSIAILSELNNNLGSEVAQQTPIKSGISSDTEQKSEAQIMSDQVSPNDKLVSPEAELENSFNCKDSN